MSKRAALVFLVVTVALLMVVQYSSLTVTNARESESDYEIGVVTEPIDQDITVEPDEPDEVESPPANSPEESTDSERPDDKIVMEESKTPLEEPNENLPINEENASTDQQPPADKPAKEKPIKLEAGVILTFDDCFIDQWYSFLNLSRDYGAKATFYVCFPNKITEDQFMKLADLEAANNEIGYHTLNHVNLVLYAQHSTVKQVIETEILPGVQILRGRGLNVTSFAYPFGAGNRALDQELLKHFSNVRYTAYTNSNQRIKDVRQAFIRSPVPQITYAMGIDKQYGHSLEEIFESIDRAHARNEVLLLYAHEISDKPNGYVTSMEMLEEIVKYVVDKQMKFYTVSEIAGL